jgi:hypothetical protein
LRRVLDKTPTISALPKEGMLTEKAKNNRKKSKMFWKSRKRKHFKEKMTVLTCYFLLL